MMDSPHILTPAPAGLMVDVYANDGRHLRRSLVVGWTADNVPLIFHRRHGYLVRLDIGDLPGCQFGTVEQLDEFAVRFRR